MTKKMPDPNELYEVRIAVRRRRKDESGDRPGFDLKVEFGAEGFTAAFDEARIKARLLCAHLDNGEAPTNG
jgi:hypothetical protein